MEYEKTVNEHYRPFWEKGIAGVEEIGALAPGFQRELAKLQYLLVKRKFNKLALICFHGFAPHSLFNRQKKGRHRRP
jgi:hypothetical protein